MYWNALKKLPTVISLSLITTWDVLKSNNNGIIMGDNNV